jgi:hypothetical protein
MPLVESTDFPGIEPCIEIDRDPGDSHSKFHVVQYVGDLVGLEMFVGYVTTDLDGQTEGDEDPIGDFVSRNPLWALNVFADKQD